MAQLNIPAASISLIDLSHLGSLDSIDFRENNAPGAAIASSAEVLEILGLNDFRGIFENTRRISPTRPQRPPAS